MDGYAADSVDPPCNAPAISTPKVLPAINFSDEIGLGNGAINFNVQTNGKGVGDFSGKSFLSLFSSPSVAPHPAITLM